MSDDDDYYLFDDDVVENPKTRLLNTLGVGTFIVLFFLITIVFVWFFSYSCEAPVKVAWRATSVGIFLLTAVVLWYAPRTSRFVENIFEEDHFDHTIIPRILVSLLTILFGIVAGVFLAGHFAEPKNLSTVEHEYTELWQDD